MESVALRNLTQRDVRIAEHPLDSLPALSSEPVGDGNAELLFETFSENGAGHTTLPGQIFTGRDTHYSVYCRMYPLPEAERPEIGEVFFEEMEIPSGQEGRGGASIRRCHIKPVFAKHIPHHQVVKDIQMGINALSIDLRKDSRTGQQALAIPRSIIMSPGVNDISEDRIVGTERRQHIKYGLLPWLFGWFGMAATDLLRKPTHGRNVFRQRFQWAPALGMREIDLFHCCQNTLHPCSPFRLEGCLFQTCIQSLHSIDHRSFKDKGFFGFKVHKSFSPQQNKSLNFAYDSCRSRKKTIFVERLGAKPGRIHTKRYADLVILGT